LSWITELFDPSAIGVMVAQFYRDIHHPQFWVALTEIGWINVLLSGDNALVIALACRGLAPRQRRWGMILGAGAAVVLRVIFTGIVASLMELPYLKLAGGLALVVIAAKLLVPDRDDEEVQSASHLWAAVQIVVVADIVMSLDNVIAVAAAADGDVPLLVLGLAISVPLIVAGAALIMAVLNRLPWLIWAGAMLLGWVAGEVVADDPAIHGKLQMLAAGAFGVKLDGLLASFGVTSHFTQTGGDIACGLVGIIVVLLVGSIWRWRKLLQIDKPAVTTAGEAVQPADRS
jgi:YjbE family integral membrane protein